MSWPGRPTILDQVTRFINIITLASEIYDEDKYAHCLVQHPPPLPTSQFDKKVKQMNCGQFKQSANKKNNIYFK